MEFETRAIHVGQEPDPATGAVTTPIYQTSTFVQEAVGVHKGYDYARVANPTRTALQECLASLEGAAHGHAFSSGLGAVTTLMHLVSPGERVVAVNDVYGGIYRMFSQVYEPKGYRFDFLSAEEISTDLPSHLDEDVRFVWLETPTNPLLNVVDIAEAPRPPTRSGALVVVDNTFATPYLQRPLELGADVALHSTTKYLGGHSDVVGGFVATNDDALSERLAFLAEVARRRAGPVRRLARPPRREDARGAHGPPLRERGGRRRPPRAPSARGACPLPGAPVAPRARDRGAPDAELRRHGLVSSSGARTRQSQPSRARGSGSSRRASAASRASSSTRPA